MPIQRRAPRRSGSGMRGDARGAQEVAAPVAYSGARRALRGRMRGAASLQIIPVAVKWLYMSGGMAAALRTNQSQPAAAAWRTGGARAQRQCVRGSGVHELRAVRQAGGARCGGVRESSMVAGTRARYARVRHAAACAQ